MTLELCNEIIVFKVAAMLHDTDAKFAIIDSAYEAKSWRKYRGNGTVHLCNCIPKIFKVEVFLIGFKKLSTKSIKRLFGCEF